MGIPVYELPAIKDIDPKYRATISDLVHRLENEPHGSTNGFLPYLEALGQGWFKKRYDKYRLVAHLRNVPLDGEIVPVAVLVDFLHRNKPEYGDGRADHLRRRYAEILNKKLGEIEQKARSWIKQPRSLIATLPPPPAELVRWLDPIQPRGKVDAFFLHANFCRIYNQLQNETDRVDVYRLLCRIEGESKNEPELTKRTIPANGCEVIFVRVREPESHFNHVILLGILTDHMAQSERLGEIDRLENTWQEVERQLLSSANDGGASAYHNALSRMAERAFPGYLLAEESLWQSLWDPQQREVFLALSSEENHTLESLLRCEARPAVIEGRAGSGKTTLLIYFTAEISSQKGLPASQILYLTQSEKLLNTSERLITNIRHRIAEEYGEGLSSEKPTFLTYHQFALNQLPEPLKGRFLNRSRRGHWLDFSTFADMLRGGTRSSPDGCRSPFARSRDCNPEAVWFVLRSYIKGYKISERDDNRWMSGDEYRENEDVPSRDQQVSVELYDQVWKEIWPWYKRLTVPCGDNNYQPKYWDDLDLAWEVLLNRRDDAPHYAVLICDEVQDLTRVELASFLRSLSWNQYDLTNLAREHNFRLPVILAGDAHQTINPSVFRWARVSSDLADAMVGHMPNLAKPSVKAVELQFNYRNARGIGQLCNALQWLREVTLGQSTTLQSLWRLPDAQPNQRVRKLILTQPNQLIDVLKDAVLIVGPAEADPNLELAREFWNLLGIDNPPSQHPNYVVPSEVKGLEHDFVAIAGFGTLWDLWVSRHRELHDFWKWKAGRYQNEVREALRFQVEYFLNRLYVAASRARDQLWIIETEAGWNAFWAMLENWLQISIGNQSEYPLKTTNALDRSSSEERNRLHDSPSAFHYSPGDIKELTTVFEGDWKKLAEEFSQLAFDQKSPEHAERASFYWERCGNPTEHKRMYAYKTYYEGKVREAAEKIWSIDRAEASRWLWEAAATDDSAWRRIAESEVESSKRRQIAQYVVRIHDRHRISGGDLEKVIRLVMDDFRERIDWTSTGDLPTYQSVYRMFLAKCREVSENETNDTIRRLYTMLRDCHPSLHNESSDHYDYLAHIAYRLHDWSEAAKNWEKAHRTNHKDYFVAKAESEDYPSCLRFWESAGQFGQIMLKYDENPEARLSNEDRRRVGRAALDAERWSTALIMFAGLDSLDATNAWEIILKAIGKDHHIVNQIRDLIREVHRALQTSADEKGSTAWTDFIFDLILASIRKENASNAKAEDPELNVRQVLQGLIYGFALDVEAGALIARIRGSWANHAEPSSNWPDFRRCLIGILQAIQKEVGDLVEVGKTQHDEIGRLCLLVLDLIWRFERTRRNEEGVNRPFFTSRFQEYVAQEDVHYGNNEAGGKATGIALIDSCYRKMAKAVRLGMQTIAKLPPDFIAQRSESGNQIWSKLDDYVRAIAYECLENLKMVGRVASDVRSAGRWEDWLLIGRFVEQSGYRKTPVEFYQELIRVAEDFGWPKKSIKIISRCLKTQRDWYQRWRDERFREKDARSPGRTPSLVYVNPGDSRKSGVVMISNTPGSKAEAVIEFLPDKYRIRFKPLLSNIDNPEIRHDEEIRIEEKEHRGDVFSFTAILENRTVKFSWEKSRRTLYVHADSQFVVPFNLRS